MCIRDRCDYAKKTAEGVQGHLEEIDAAIERYALGWKKQRISKVALAVLRLAVYEMKYEEDVPVAVSYTHLDVYKRQPLRFARCNGY